MSLYPAPYWRSVVSVVATIFLLSKLGPPQILSSTHHRSENLVVVLAAAQASGDAMRQLLPGRIGICLKVSDCGHDEAGHAKRALKTLLVDNALLHWVQGSIRVGQTFDGQNFPPPHGVGQYGTGIVRNVVEEHRARSTFGAIAPQFCPGEAQFVAQSRGQRLLFHYVDAPLLAVYVERDQAFADTRNCLLAVKQRRSAKQIAGRGDGHTAGDDSFNEVAPRYRLRDGFGCFMIGLFWFHTRLPLIVSSGHSRFVERGDYLDASLAIWSTRNNAGIRKFPSFRHLTTGVVPQERTWIVRPQN